MKTFFTTACAAALGALTFITSAAAQPAEQPAPNGAPGRDTGRGGRGEANNNFQRGGNFGGGLNFDEKQRELLQEARQVHADDIRKLNDKLAEAQKEYVKAVVAEKYDEASVRAKADAIGKIQAEILALNGKSFATVSPTLKPEQREGLEGNVRIGIAVISPAQNFGVGIGGNMAGGNFGGRGGPGGGGDFNQGGRGNFGGGQDTGAGPDRAIRRGGDRGERGAPGAPGGRETERRREANPGQ
jgi:Spy/CpxP family protein refolding chaperone